MQLLLPTRPGIADSIFFGLPLEQRAGGHLHGACIVLVSPSLVRQAARLDRTWRLAFGDRDHYVRFAHMVCVASAPSSVSGFFISITLVLPSDKALRFAHVRSRSWSSFRWGHTTFPNRVSFSPRERHNDCTTATAKKHPPPSLAYPFGQLDGWRRVPLRKIA